MSQMLASDLANPDFVGATNPDSLLFVEFYWHRSIDQLGSEKASLEAGKRVIVYKKKYKLVQNGVYPKTDEPRMVPQFTDEDDRVPYVRIMKPGDNTTMIETPVREDHKQRWPEKWLVFQMQEGLVEQQRVPGWQLDEWPHLDDKPSLLRELKHARFQTVDQVAGASDAQVQRMGVGGLGIREQARVDLRNRVAKDAMEAVAAKDKEIAEMKERMARLEAAITQNPTEQPQAEKPKRGRPRKPVEATPPSG